MFWMNWDCKRIQNNGSRLRIFRAHIWPKLKLYPNDWACILCVQIWLFIENFWVMDDEDDDDDEDDEDDDNDDNYDDDDDGNKDGKW